jgi:hypothetical protein
LQDCESGSDAINPNHWIDLLRRVGRFGEMGSNRHEKGEDTLGAIVFLFVKAPESVLVIPDKTSNVNGLLEFPRLFCLSQNRVKMLDKQGPSIRTDLRSPRKPRGQGELFGEIE